MYGRGTLSRGRGNDLNSGDWPSVAARKARTKRTKASGRIHPALTDVRNGCYMSQMSQSSVGADQLILSSCLANYCSRPLR
jgi:hypothetical protein